MTGYGKASCIFEHKNISLELRSVNSKQLDLNVRLPMLYKEKELEIRGEITRNVERGKVDFFIVVEQSEPDRPVQVNRQLVKDYFNQIKNIAGELEIPVTENILLAALRLPETLKSEQNALSDEESKVLLGCLNEAIAAFNNFRAQEGKALENDISARVSGIELHLQDLSFFEQARIDRIKERLQKNLNEFIPSASIDNNRFEQEIIYFLEKLDITEEKVRLKNHCVYFLKTMQSEASSGRKLAFIVQEMGREINTIGSKANDADIQKHVIMMKDELEKIKEQLLNVL